MNGRFAPLLGVVMGVLAIRLTLTGEYLNYVRPVMGFWLVLSGLVLIALGVAGWRSAWKQGDGHADCSHGHSHGLSRASMLLILPILVVGLTQAAPLGSFAANRQNAGPPRGAGDAASLAQRFIERSAGAGLSTLPAPADDAPQASAVEPPPEPTPAPLATSVAGLAVPNPATGEVAEMSLISFMEITYYDETEALAGVPIRMIGFVVPSPGRSGEFLLSRFLINCCAADATLMQAGIQQVPGPVPAQDTWVSVTGRWFPDRQGSQVTPDGFPVPELVADRVEIIPAPENPYLSLAVE